jgi:hypothetical protein
MAKFSHILKLQSGGTFKSYSAALPTDTQLRDIGPYAPSQEEAAQSGLATPEFPDMDLSDIENAEGYTGDKQEILGEAMRIQNKIKINLANNPLYRDSAEFTKDLGDLQYYKYFGKNNIIQQYKSGERYMEMMEKTYHNKDMYLMDASGNYGTIQDDGSVAYVRPEVAFTDPKRMIQYETIADQRHFNTSITKNYLLEKVINVNGNAVADKELAELFSEVKSTVEENGSYSFGQYVVNGKALDVLKENVNKTTTNVEGLLDLASIIESRMSSQTRNTYTTKTWQVMSYKYGGADGLREVMASGDEEVIEKFRTEYSQEYTKLVLQAASGHYERSNKNSIKGIPGGGSGSEDGNRVTTPYISMTRREHGAEKVVIGDTLFDTFIGGSRLFKKDGKMPETYKETYLKQHALNGRKGVKIVNSTNKGEGEDGEILENSVVESVNYVHFYPMHNGVPITNITANPRANAKLVVEMQVIESDLGDVKNLLLDARKGGNKEEIERLEALEVEHTEKLNEYYDKNDVLNITSYEPAAIVRAVASGGNYSWLGRDVFKRGSLKHAPTAWPSSADALREATDTKHKSKNVKAYTAIVALNPDISYTGEVEAHKALGNNKHSMEDIFGTHAGHMGRGPTLNEMKKIQ